MRTIDGIDYAEHGDVVDMELHRGGGYFRDSSIHEGGAWTRQHGVVTVKQAAFQSLGHTYGNPDGEVLRANGSPQICWVVFFVGDIQATNTRMDHRGFPDGPKTFVRQATEEELRIAEMVFGFRGRPYPLGPLPGEGAEPTS